MRVRLSMYGSRGAVEPMAGRATPEGAAAAGCGAPAAIGVLATGGWR